MSSLFQTISNRARIRLENASANRSKILPQACCLREMLMLSLDCQSPDISPMVSAREVKVVYKLIVYKYTVNLGPHFT